MARCRRKSGSRASVTPTPTPARPSTGAVSPLHSRLSPLDPLARSPYPQTADLAHLVTAAGIGLVVLDRNLRLCWASPAAVGILQLQATDTNKTLDTLTCPLTDLIGDARRVCDMLTPVEREWRHPDGRWFLISIRPVTVADGVATTLVLTLADISRIRTTELRTGHQQLRALSQRLLEAQEAERRALAAEMHDEIGQLLTGLNLLLLSIDPYGDAAITAAYLAQAQRTVGELIARVRHLSLDLRPPMLDDLGLRPTLDWLVERYTAQTRVQVNLSLIGLEQRFPPMLELVVYRIIQEALTNVARHAETNSVTVRVWVDAGALHVLVEDQGRGFDPAMLDPYHSSGLSGMSERVALLGGTLTITSAPGAGTSIHAVLPICPPESPLGQS